MILRALCRSLGFMLLNCREVYGVLLPRVGHRVEGLFSCFDWGDIWSSLRGPCIAPRPRELVYRMLHESLPTNARLFMLGLVGSDGCVRCGECESQLHVFYFCPRIQGLVDWLRDTVVAFCGPGVRVDLLSFLFF